MKKILGLDLGPNSIGWAVVSDAGGDGATEAMKHLEACGSRIIPMDAAMQGDFEKGNSVSQTAERTGYRSMRRLRERCLLRRERLNRVLDAMGFLPAHYSAALTRHGKFKADEGCKLAWRTGATGRPEFVFGESYAEMLEEFRQRHGELLAGGMKVPYDWTIYYLRKKALTRPVTKQELAWLLLSFNKKRGYYQLRGDDAEEDKGKAEEFMALKVVDIKDTGERKGKNTWYDIVLENGMVYHRAAPARPDWVGEVKEFIVTTQLDKDGKARFDKEGNVRRSFRMPGENDWTLIKKKTETDIDRSGKTVGEYIYDALLANPRQKVRGRLVRTIERRYYRQELEQILNSQKRFIPELADDALYEVCTEALYPSNAAYRRSIKGRGFTYLFVDNIMFYQRPLKSKKSLIDGCPYESHTYTDKDTGERKAAAVKCAARSNPLAQELRLWQFLSNLRIYLRQEPGGGALGADADVTHEFLATAEERARLFDWLNDRTDISQDALFYDYFKVKRARGKGAACPYRWNYVEDKAYPCNETRGLMLRYLDNAGVERGFLTPGAEKSLWHILYSVDDRQQLRSALCTFAGKHGLGEGFAEAFSKFPPFKKDYAAYSEKAMRKLLPLMRIGHHWNEADIDKGTRVRIDKIIDGEYDETITPRIREMLGGMTDISQYGGLPLWLACYVAYNRHSEAKDASAWTSPDDIDRYLARFRQHSLRNPIVEQVVTETLRTVRDVWRQCGRIDEIHIELGRNMKQTAEQRRKAMQRIADNENANIRAKALLAEFMNPEFGIGNVRPHSPGQQELLRIYEDAVLGSAGEIDDSISEIIRKLGETDVKKRPSHSEVMRYKLWLDQKYISPYTGRPIPLARLFTADYQIEHIIPQSRYFDDSFSNKVICEAAVNALKDRMLGMEFIKEKHGQIVELGNGATASILSVEEYERLVAGNYKGNRAKMRKLLMDDIPADFIARQLNDSRYISKLVKTLMSNIVREEGEGQDLSKNVITTNGAITDRLKADWGVKDVWNRIVLPRFRRLNEMTRSSKYTAVTAGGHEVPDIPLELQKGFSKKRIDHRHHAMDAVVIACTTREHVNLLSNEAAMDGNNANRYQLSRKLRRYEKVEVARAGGRKTIEVAKEFIKPWPAFCADLEQALRAVIVSFKHNQRVINKTSNRYQHFENGKKTVAVQTKGDSWAVRKPLHKETVYGEVNLRVVREVTLKEAMKRPKSVVDKDLKKKITELLGRGFDEKRMRKYFADNSDAWRDFNPAKVKTYCFTQEILGKDGRVKDRYFATRKPLDTSFGRKYIEEHVADSGIRKILLRHLEVCGEDAEAAFSPEGIEAMNRTMADLNGGKPHQPVYKVRIYEKGEKFAVGSKGNKAAKFVEAAKGTNLFFAVYEAEAGGSGGRPVRKRSYVTVPLYEAVRRAKAGEPVAPQSAQGGRLAFVLSPNDLVYLPTAKEAESGVIGKPLDKDRIYKMVSATGSVCYFIKQEVASCIADKFEFFSLNKMERAITGEMIKETCVPVKVDRLGNVVEINGEKP